jgi:methionyl aminopeptidase
MAESTEVDYTLNNPDTLTKYKTAAQISHKVLEAVTGTIRMLLWSVNQ